MATGQGPWRWTFVGVLIETLSFNIHIFVSAQYSINNRL